MNSPIPSCPTRCGRSTVEMSETVEPARHFLGTSSCERVSTINLCPRFGDVVFITWRSCRVHVTMILRYGQRSRSAAWHANLILRPEGPTVVSQWREPLEPKTARSFLALQRAIDRLLPRCGRSPTPCLSEGGAWSLACVPCTLRVGASSLWVINRRAWRGWDSEGFTEGGVAHSSPNEEWGRAQSCGCSASRSLRKLTTSFSMAIWRRRAISGGRSSRRMKKEYCVPSAPVLVI